MARKYLKAQLKASQDRAETLCADADQLLAKLTQATCWSAELEAEVAKFRDDLGRFSYEMNALLPMTEALL